MTTLRYCLITATSLLLLGCGNDVSSAKAGSDISAADQDITTKPLEKKEGAIMHLIGTIKYQDFEGGFYGFIAENGKKYTLNKLTQEYRRDGLIIEITAEPMQGMATTTQFGELLNVHTIKVIDDTKVRVIGNKNIM